MRKNLFLGIIILTGILGFASCQRNAPYERRSFPQEYTLAYEEIYGHYYDSTAAVVALDLYSEGVAPNEDHIIKGTGYNLYLSDIFVPDSLLVPGTYRSDTSAAPFTFVPGKDFEGMPHGMYILNIEDNEVTHIQVLDSGSFIYRNDSLLFTLYYRNDNGYDVEYNASFAGKLKPWKKQ